MDRNKLKALLKPLIKEALKECILEEGVISTIIRESMSLTVNDVAPRQVVREQRAKPSSGKNKFAEAYESHSLGEDDPSENSEVDDDALIAKQEEIAASRRRIAESLRSRIGADIFEGTEAIGGDPMQELAAGNNPGVAAAKGPLADVDPNDEGVNLGLITEIAGGRKNWKQVMERV